MEYSCRASVRAQVKAELSPLGPYSDPATVLTRADGKEYNMEIMHAEKNALLLSFDYSNQTFLVLLWNLFYPFTGRLKGSPSYMYVFLIHMTVLVLSEVHPHLFHLLVEMGVSMN